MLQIISSPVLQQSVPQESPILGYLVDFQEKVFYDLFNFKIKNHLYCHLQASYVYLFLLVSEA